MSMYKMPKGFSWVVTDGINPMYYSDELYHHIITHCENFDIFGAAIKPRKNRFSRLDEKIPVNRLIKAEVDNKYAKNMGLTAKELIEELKKVHPDSPVRFQWIEDKYIYGCQESSTFKGEKVENPLSNTTGWRTYDMTCDGVCGMNIDEDRLHEPEIQKKYCSRCPHRNRYIDATRCFIVDNELFIDGHW